MSDIRSFMKMSNGNGPAAPKAAGGTPPAAKKGSIENTYQKKSQLEHILLRPDTYIGSVERVTELQWIFDEEQGRMVQKEISYVPGLYKIFDEILVNAADNKQRDKTMNCIKIDINKETNTISVWNNGTGIPVVMHKEEKMFVPTMIFGHLLTSSNYNDEEAKVTGGRNGYGAKLCNIFSSKFTVETASSQYKKIFKQTWGDNMTKATEARINDISKTDYTKVTFQPDLTKFKMEQLEDDIIALMSRRAYDVAASTRGVSVFLNGKKLPVKNFKEYVDLYVKNREDDGGVPFKICYENVNERWEVAITLSDHGFQQVSFVNSIATTKGGRHVDYVTDSVIKQLIEIIKKKNKGGLNIKPFQVKNHMWIFINCLIVNPTFDSQTKENMTLQAKSFGSKCAVSEKFIKTVATCGIVESVLSWAKTKESIDLAKTSGKKHSKIKGIPKLEDANEAGTKNAHLCTLILTEGDSAKSLAVSGLGVIGRDHYGVFPLRGKLLNVREATHKQLLENAEINNLIKIIGLQYKKKYLTMDDLKSLRYGKVMIMTDQDQDGSHIKGLLINFIHNNWPELLRLPFLEEFITPLVKVTKRSEVLSFYSLPEYEEWKKDTPNHNTYQVKYYKGLGTSTSAEAKEYFQNMAKHRIVFNYGGGQDDDNIVMAFAKKSVEQRKDWLTNHMEECKRRKLLGLPDRYLYTKGTTSISYSDFINLELIQFSNADNERSIPCLVDGLKPGQRKVMFTCFLRNDKREVKVAQLAGSIAEKSAYHHGEQSLCSTIVNLAQNFVGSNNINLLEPRGQFGTRLCGGKDSASPRYIFTIMSPLTRLIFHPDDDCLLEYQVDDSQRIEPVWYIPIIPMVLVNGSEGIGTGWATKIPNYNPRQIIGGIRQMIQGDQPSILHPHYKNFRGSIDFVADQKYLSNGIISIIGSNKIEITELPVGTWTQTYKENVLEPLLHGTEKAKPIISDYKEYHTDTTVRFVCTFVAGEFDNLRAEQGGFHRVFKLSGSISTSQMHAFDANNCLRRFNNANDILKEFYDLRLEYYGKRKQYLVGKLGAEAAKLSNQARFILEKCNNQLIVENKKRKVMCEELIKRGYEPDPIAEWKRKANIQDEEEESVDEGEEEGESSSPVKGKKGPAVVQKPVDPDAAFKKLADVKKFDYLLGMAMWMLTDERKAELLKRKDEKLTELNILKSKTPSQIWLADLAALEKKLNEVEEKERKEELGTMKKSQASHSGKGKRGNSEIHPAANGIAVKFEITSDMIKKMEKAAESRKKGPDVKKEKKEIADGASQDEPDEFDALIDDSEKKIKAIAADVASKVKKATKEKAPKKEKAPPKPKKEPKKKKGGSDFDSDMSDDAIDESFVSVQPTREKTGRRAATKVTNYSALLNSDEEDESDMEMKPTAAALNMSGGPEVANFSDSDDDFDSGPSNSKPSINKSDDLFDSLKEDTPVKPVKRKLGPIRDDSSPDTKPAKKQRQTKKKEDDGGAKKKRAPKKKKKETSDEESDIDFDEYD